MRNLFTTHETMILPSFMLGILIHFFSIILLSTAVFSQANDTLWFEDWESCDMGSWFASNGVWEVGMPTVGPLNPSSGQCCAGTVLDGNYTNSANTRLTSPQISLPSLLSGEKLKLRFWHWYRMHNSSGHYDHGFVQISTDNGNTWATISGNYDEYSEVWSQAYIDISAYASSVVRIGFYFVSSSAYTDNGWYIDDISMLKGPDVFYNPENFELEMGDWSVDNGLWEVGSPTVGPPSAHSGQICAGTVLNGNYFNSANTRLVSPEVTLTPIAGQNPELFFWHWYIMHNSSGHYDHGLVQISVNGGTWQTISDPYDENSGAWTQAFVPLSAYADSTVRIAFLFMSSSAYEDNGWYIDDIRIEGIDDTTGIVADENNTEMLITFSLAQNYPNPFNPSTTISYQLAKSGKVELKIYNMLGQEVRKLVDENQAVGEYTTEWDGRDYSGKVVSSGVYFYRLKAGQFVDTKKMLLLH
jgi:bacillopeptidase F (M6 metalloprotease family)